MSDTPRPGNTNLKWILPLVIIVVAIAVLLLLMMSRPQAPSRPVSEKVWSVRTLTVTPGEYRPMLELYGRVESPRMTHVTAAVTAFVAEVNTDEGGAMHSGDLLIKLDDRDVRLLVAQRQADVTNLEAQLQAEQVRHEADLSSLKIQQNLLQLSLNTVQRYENLNKRKVASQEQLDAARRDYQQQRLAVTERKKAIADHPNRVNQINAQLERARSLLESAQLDLERTAITAPFDGRIAGLNVAPGDRVRSGDALLQYYNLQRLEVRSQIPSRILPQLRMNDKGPTLAEGEIDNHILELELSRIAAEVEAGRAGVDAFFSIKAGNYLPEPGRSLSIQVKLPAQDNLISLPPVSLYGLDRVYKVVEGRLQAVKVTRVGDSIDEQGNPLVLIRSEQLQPGDQVITTQLPNAISGLRVKEVAADA